MKYQIIADPAQCRETLAACRREGRLFKTASGLGGDPEASFEQALASLSFSYVKDKAPRLLDFVKGFQLVDRNEDNTKSIGIFGFQLDGGQWVYAPVFFLNGDLKGHELLYLKNQDQFVPLKENWVNYLLARKPHVLGQQTPETLRSLGVLQPNVRDLGLPPFSGKSAAAQPQYAPWFEDFLPNLAHLVTASPATMQKFAGLDEAISVPNLCSRAPWAAQMMKNACDTYPEIDRLCNHFYGTGWLKQAVEKLKDKATKDTADVGGSVLGNTMDNEDAEQRSDQHEDVLNKKEGSFVLTGRMPAQKLAAGDPVEIRTIDDLTITFNESDLSESEREKIYRDGYLVKDYRTGEEVTKEYSVQQIGELVNPDDTGLYDVLLKPGKIEEGFIIQSPHTGRGRCDFSTLLDPSSKDWVNAHQATMYVTPQRRTRSEQREWYDGLDGVSEDSLKEDTTYIVLSQNKLGELDGTTPFRIKRKIGKGRYIVDWYNDCDQNRPPHLRRQHRETGFGADFFGQPGELLTENYDEGLYGNGNFLQFSDHVGTRMKSMQGSLLIPMENKILKVSNPRMEDYGGSRPMPIDEHQSEKPSLEPGNWADIQLQILQKTAELKLYCDGEHVSINAGPLVTKKAALFELVKAYGFREKSAKHLIREAEADRRRGKPKIAHVKYAQGYPMLGPGPSAPPIPEPQYGYDSTYGGTTTQYGQEDFRSVPELSSGMTDPSVYDSSPEAMPDPMAMQAAQQGGQMNQKEVFDTSMLTGLLKVVRQDSMVDRYTGDLMKALDRLGRMLFLFYWHQDEFMDRYGKADLPELEDSLRNTFEQVGDLLLFLKEKDVAPIMGGVVSEPDVQQTGE